MIRQRNRICITARASKPGARAFNADAPHKKRLNREEKGTEEHQSAESHGIAAIARIGKQIQLTRGVSCSSAGSGERLAVKPIPAIPRDHGDSGD